MVTSLKSSFDSIDYIACVRREYYHTDRETEYVGNIDLPVRSAAKEIPHKRWHSFHLKLILRGDEILLDATDSDDQADGLAGSKAEAAAAR